MRALAARRSPKAFGVVFLLVVMIATILMPVTAFALNVGGDILTGTVVWRSSDSPVYVADPDFVVAPGASLQIEAGVTVLFAGAVTAYGTLTAAGSSAAPVVFDALSPLAGWGTLAFSRLDCADPHNRNLLDHVILANMNGGLVVDRQSLTVAASSFDIVTDEPTALAAFNDNDTPCPGAGAALIFRGNTLAFETTYSGWIPARVIDLDGMNASFTGNTVDAVFSGNPYEIRTVVLDTPSSAPSVVFDGNAVRTDSFGDGTTFLYGLSVATPIVTAAVTNNTFALNGMHEIYGLTLWDNPAVGNKITAASLSPNESEEIDVIGIYSQSENPLTPLESNHVIIASGQVRYLIALVAQGGLIRDNRLIAELTSASGAIIGILQRLGSATIEYNSIRLSAPPTVGVYGIFLQINGAGDYTTVKYNVIQGSGGTNSKALFVASAYDGAVENSYNVLYNFTTLYYGIAPGTGDVYADPMFTDPYELTVSVASPALALNAGAMLPEPEPVSEPLSDPEPLPDDDAGCSNDHGNRYGWTKHNGKMLGHDKDSFGYCKKKHADKSDKKISNPKKEGKPSKSEHASEAKSTAGNQNAKKK